MRIAKRMMALCLSLLVLMMSTAHADVPFLMHSNGWNLDSTPLDVTLKADVNTHMPFDDDRLAMLTPLLELMSLHLVTGNDEGKVTIGISDQDALTLQYRGNDVQLSAVPGVTYTTESDPVSMLLGENTSFPGMHKALGLSPDGESLIVDGRALMGNIPQLFEEKGKKKQNTTSISGFARAAYTMDYTITTKPEDFQAAILSACPEGWLKDIIAGLTFTGKQSIRIHFNADDVIVRLEYNGACGPKGAQRTVKLIWKQLHNDSTDKDFIELTSTAKTGSNKNNLTFERTISTNKSGARTIVGSFKYTKTKDSVTEIWNGEYNLSNAYTEDADVLGGDFMIQTRLGGDDKYNTTIIAPALVIKGTQDDPEINGTLSITEKYAQRVTEEAVVSIDLHRAEPLVWSVAERVIDLSAMEEAQLKAAQAEAAAAMATALVRPLIVMLGANAEYFFREMPAEAVQSIIDAAAPAANTPMEAE